MSKTKGNNRMKDLLAKVTGSDKDMGEEEALASLAPIEDAETAALVAATVASINDSMKAATPSSYDSAVAAASGNVTVNPTMFEKAYDVSYDDDLKRYVLHTIAYNDTGEVKYIGKEVFAQGLPEASHKLNAMMLDKLIYTMSPNYRPRRK